MKEFQQEDTPGRKMYRFDEVVFMLPEDAPQEAAGIEADFAAWWEYGQEDRNTQPDPDVSDPLPDSGVMSLKEVTEALKQMQEQNTLLEECLLEMSGVVYA